MHELEALSICEGYRLFEDVSCKGAGCNVSIYLTEPGVLEPEITKAVVNKNAAASSKESWKAFII